MYGLCSYPMSSKNWIWSRDAKRPAAIECTGASPQRCNRSVCVLRRLMTSAPRSKILPVRRGSQRTRYTRGPARNRGPRSQSYSKLELTGEYIYTTKMERWDPQWQRLYESPPLFDINPSALSFAIYSGCSFTKSGLQFGGKSKESYEHTHP